MTNKQAEPDPDISAMGLIAHGWKDRSEVEERAK